MTKLSPPPPAVILQGAQLGENIGTAARAMRNFGLSDLRLVSPKEGWSLSKAKAAAAGGAGLLDRVKIYDELESAFEGLDYVIAATARRRDMNKDILLPQQAAIQLRGEKNCGILFGPERSGLENEAIALCDAIVEIPADADFSSLNLAQAVLLLGYHWFISNQQMPALEENELASKLELFNLFKHLERELEEVRFFKSPNKRPIMVRNLRNIFQRAHLSSAEIKALRGVIAALVDESARRGTKK